MKNQKKRKKWLRFRHRVAQALIAFALRPYIRLRYGIRIERFRGKKKRQYLCLSNHQTAFDQFFVGLALPRPFYYVASDDLFTNGFVSRLIKWLVEPIPFTKSTSDAKAVMTCMRVAREGGSIALFPEGNRTYDGTPVYMKPGVAKLVRALRLPVALFRIEGGYGAHPRWSDVVRRGKMRAYVCRVLEPEEYAAMTDEELYEVIRTALYVSEGCDTGEYRHKKNAEYLERAMYVCPTCGLSRFESHGESISCLGCGVTVRHMPNKELVATNGTFPFRFVSEWYAYQNDFVQNLDLTQHKDAPLYEDMVRFSRVIPCKRREVLARGATLSLEWDRVSVQKGEFSMALPYPEVVAMSVLGKNKLNIYTHDHTYQVKGDKRFNALKYMNIYYHFAHQLHKFKEEDADGEFLGL